MSCIRDGDSLAVGGFGVAGAPVRLMRAVVASDATDLTLIANNGALFDWQMGELLDQGRVRRVIASHIGLNRRLERAFRAGDVDVELVPQGTLVERLRAGGAGLPAFFTTAGAGTLVEYGGLPSRYDAFGAVLAASQAKEARDFGDVHAVLEHSLRPDVCLVRAAIGDSAGNLVYHQSARNFNPVWASAGKWVVAEVEHLVDVGDIDPEQVHTPGIYVDAVVEVGADDKRFELPWHDVRAGDSDNPDDAARHRIARRAARELTPGSYVNLGVGIPTLVPLYVEDLTAVVLQSENGVVGLGAAPERHAASHDLVDASKRPASVLPGAAFVDSASAFAMIRGGRLDLTILGGMQVSERGDLANWMVPGKAVAGMGGAMDLVAGARRVVVATMHHDPQGRSKLVQECTYPLTGARVVDRVITEKAVIDVTPDGFVLRELAPGVTVNEIIQDAGVRILVPEPPVAMEPWTQSPAAPVLRSSEMVAESLRKETA